MAMKSILLAAGLSLAAGPVFAADVCLQNNSIRTWDVVDGKTLLVTDQRRNVFRVELTGVCTGLDDSRFALGFTSVTPAGCVTVGDSVRYNDPAFGPQRCHVAAVHLDTPAPAAN